MADLVLVNGTVWTANSAQPWAEAVAIDGDRILRVGRTSDIKRLVGKKTKVIDLKGALALPGFIDSHTHFLKGGFALSSIQLRDVTSREQFVQRVEAKVRELEKESGSSRAIGITNNGTRSSFPGKSGSTRFPRRTPCASAAMTCTSSWSTAWP